MILHDKQRRAAVFDAIGEAYDRAFADKTGQIDAANWLLELLPRGARVLDVGSGTGIPTAKLLAEGGLDVLGIDISMEMVRVARRNVPAARFEQACVMEIELADHELDAAVAFFSLLMLPREAIVSALGKMRRAVRPGGYVQISMIEADLDYVELVFMGQPVCVSAYPEAELEALLRRQGFEIAHKAVVNFIPGADAIPERQLFFSCGVGT